MTIRHLVALTLRITRHDARSRSTLSTSTGGGITWSPKRKEASHVARPYVTSTDAYEQPLVLPQFGRRREGELKGSIEGLDCPE